MRLDGHRLGRPLLRVMADGAVDAYHALMTIHIAFPLRRVVPHLLLICLLVGGSVGEALAATPVKLSAEVGPGSNITLKKGTREVKKLKAGKYIITVRDRAKTHNFRLIGPRVNRSTQVSKIETRTWEVTLRVGIYRFLCDPHAGFMSGSVEVTR